VQAALVTTETPALGPTLRGLRRARNLTLAELAALVGTSESHLSRIETGKREDISRHLIARLAQALDAPAELARAAGKLPAERESQIAAYAGALGAEYDRLTGPALRRLDAVPAGESLFARTPNATRGGQVDTRVLCRFRGCDPRPETAADAPPVTFAAAHPVTGLPGWAAINPGGGSETATRLRFLEAHAAVHLEAGSYTCTLPRLSTSEEVRFIDITCAALAPRTLLDRALRIAAAAGNDTNGGPDIWGTSGTSLVEDVATSLGIPTWVAVRRLAEEGLLEDQALYESMPGSAA
jgi:transcriptional regulator with XRE-family HTH domain